MVEEGTLFPNFSAADIEELKAKLHAPSIDETVVPVPTTFAQPKRRRGRPRKNPLPEFQDQEASTPEKLLTPAKLTKRDEREVADRLSKLMTGLTGLAAIPSRPYVEMTDEEAKDISEPLASYLIRNADTIPIAHQILENYDLAAIVLGVMAYVVRVYGDRRHELSERPATRVGTKQAERPTLVRVTEIQDATNAGVTNEGTDTETGPTYPSRFVATAVPAPRL
jgi:hypothetical protein